MPVTLKEGDKAPDFKGLDQNDKAVQLTDFKGKNLILYFYPKDNTPGCTKEACDLRDNYDYWLNKGYAVIGVSPDSAASSAQFDLAREMLYKTGAQMKAYIGYELAQENGSINTADTRDSVRDQYLDNVYEYQKLVKS